MKNKKVVQNVRNRETETDRGEREYILKTNIRGEELQYPYSKCHWKATLAMLRKIKTIWQSGKQRMIYRCCWWCTDWWGRLGIGGNPFRMDDIIWECWTAVVVVVVTVLKRTYSVIWSVKWSHWQLWSHWRDIQLHKYKSICSESIISERWLCVSLPLTMLFVAVPLSFCLDVFLSVSMGIGDQLDSSGIQLLM